MENFRNKQAPMEVRKRFKDTLKASLKDFDVVHNSWGRTAQNRAAWRGAINKGAATYESRLQETAKSKRATRKSRASSDPAIHDPTALPCPHCPRTLRAKIGIFSHLRTHGYDEGLLPTGGTSTTTGQNGTKCLVSCCEHFIHVL